MTYYKNAVCPVCKELLTEQDDVVVCPECGEAVCAEKKEKKRGLRKWQLALLHLLLKDGAEIALMTDGADGAQPMAMGSADGVLFLTDEKSRVYVYAGEAYVTAALLEQLGVKVLLVSGTPVIH